MRPYSDAAVHALTILQSSRRRQKPQLCQPSWQDRRGGWEWLCQPASGPISENGRFFQNPVRTRGELVAGSTYSTCYKVTYYTQKHKGVTRLLKKTRLGERACSWGVRVPKAKRCAEAALVSEHIGRCAPGHVPAEEWLGPYVSARLQKSICRRMQRCSCEAALSRSKPAKRVPDPPLSSRYATGNTNEAKYFAGNKTETPPDHR